MTLDASAAGVLDESYVGYIPRNMYLPKVREAREESSLSSSTLHNLKNEISNWRQSTDQISGRSIKCKVRLLKCSEFERYTLL